MSEDLVERPALVDAPHLDVAALGKIQSEGIARVMVLAPVVHGR